MGAVSTSRSQAASLRYPRSRIDRSHKDSSDSAGDLHLGEGTAYSRRKLGLDRCDQARNLDCSNMPRSPDNRCLYCRDALGRIDLDHPGKMISKNSKARFCHQHRNPRAAVLETHISHNSKHRPLYSLPPRLVCYRPKSPTRRGYSWLESSA